VDLGKSRIVHLKIPSDYIRGLIRGPDGTTAFVDIEAYLPDIVSERTFRSRLIGVSDPTQIAAERIRNWLFLSLESTDGLGETNIKSLISSAKQVFSRDGNQSSANFEAYDTLPPFAGQGNGYDYNTLRTIYYIPTSGENYVFSCAGEHTESYHCEGNFYYRDEIQVDVEFKPVNFSRGQEIMSSIRKFISTIEVDAR
jgi:hypothetical protein